MAYLHSRAGGIMTRTVSIAKDLQKQHTGGFVSHRFRAPYGHAIAQSRAKACAEGAV